MEAIKNSSLQSKLEALVGETRLYRGRQVTVKGYGVTGGQIRIINQGNTITFPVGRAKEELAEFLPVADEQAEQTPARQSETAKQAVAVFQSDASQMNKLEDVLMDNISKLQEDDKFLEQAKEINKTARTMLAFSKQKLEMIKEMREAQKLSGE